MIIIRRPKQSCIDPGQRSSQINSIFCENNRIALVPFRCSCDNDGRIENFPVNRKDMFDEGLSGNNKKCFVSAHAAIFTAGQNYARHV